MKHLDKVEEYIMLVTFPVMLITVLGATFTRFFNLFSMPWGDELARYLMIWLGFAGIGYGFKKNAHLGLGFVVDKCPPTLRKILVLVRVLIIILFGVLVSWFTYKILGRQFAFHQVSPSLNVPMWSAYLAVFVGGVLTVVRSVQFFWGIRPNADDDAPRTEGK